MYRVRTSDVWFNMGGCVAAYCPVMAPNPIAARQNVRNNMATPGQYVAVPGTAPTWMGRTGWTLNGSTQWLETGITPINNQTWTALVRFSNFAGGAGNTGCFIGLIQGCRFAITQTLTTATVYQNGSYLIVSQTPFTDGVLGVAGNQGYYNGFPNGSTIASSGGSFSGTIALGQTKESGFEYYLNGKLQAVTIYSRPLTASEIWQASYQMKYCDVNPDWSAWGVRRRYFIMAQTAVVFNPAWAANQNKLIGGGTHV